MTVAIISDVHSNLEALTAVLNDADAHGATRVWCTGDIVGYGPDPSAVLSELKRRDATMIAGNHDLAACGRIDVGEFNPVAAEAALWTRGRLSDAERDFLASLPLTRVEGDFTLVHGTLREPDWEYLLTPVQAAAQFELQQTLYSVVGHTHVPMVVQEASPANPQALPSAYARLPAMRRLMPGDAISLDEQRLIVNPGGLGQPRDGDPRAPYLLYDERAATITFHRVAYDIETTQQKIRDAGLPDFLATRLARGQ
jgi:diadenosine tetraphosphatase ApaH/serine/threonine PP2A family protein phosphatase